MGLITDLRGRRFGRLSVSPHAEPEIRERHAYWPLTCDCGAERLVRGSKLLAGAIVSCGCWRADPAVRSGARLSVPAARRRALAKARRRAGSK